MCEDLRYPEISMQMCPPGSHKINGLVWGQDGGAKVIPADKNVLPFYITSEYVAEHKPQTGGYVLVTIDQIPWSYADTMQ